MIVVLWRGTIWCGWLSSTILSYEWLVGQVSNWFINARVRLWKPMIEEMFAEMNKRKACRNEQGMESSHGNRRINMTNLN